MKNTLIVIALLYCLTATSQTLTGNITHDGLTRDYRIYLPTTYDTCSHMPLVFNLHGRGSTAFQQEFYTQFNLVAEANNFIVLYPNAINNEWNVSGSGVDDVGLISALIDSINLTYNIDLNRVYSTGMSMGGFMSYRLACELNDRIAAIASVTGLHATIPCNPGRAVPLMQIHGTADPTVPFSGVAPTMQFWLQNNNCATPPDTIAVPDIDTNDGATATKYLYDNCTDSTEIILYVIKNGEHTWPDAFIDIGITSHDFNASEVIWDFFKKYSLNIPNAGNACDSVSTNITMAASEIKVYPNPATNYLVVENRLKQNSFIEIMDTYGKKVLKQQIPGERLAISLNDFPKGIYFFRMSQNGSKLKDGKLLIQ